MLSRDDKKHLLITIYGGIVRVIKDFIIPEYKLKNIKVYSLIVLARKYEKRITKLEKAIA